MRPSDTVLAAERSLIASMLRHNSAIGEVVQDLRRDDLYQDDHQILFDAMVKLWDDGKKVDAVTIADALHRWKKLDDVGGYPGIARLLECAEVGLNIQAYLEIVKDSSLRRRVGFASQTINREIEKPSMKASDVLQLAEREIFAIAENSAGGQVVDLAEALGEALDKIDAASTSTKIGTPTGFVELDTLTGGFQPGELVILAARPSVGKTAMALSLVDAATLAGVPTFMSSLEQSRAELAARMLSARARVDGNSLRLGRLAPDQTRRLLAARDALAQQAFFIDDKPTQSLLRIASTARRMRVRNKIGLVLIDYLQLIEPENRREQRSEQVSHTCQRLKALARELGIPVVALAQLNRASEEGTRRRPRLIDLRESGGIEQAADTIWLLHRPDDERRDDPEIIEVILAKQRNGPTGMVALHYHRKYTFFETYCPSFGDPRNESERAY